MSKKEPLQPKKLAFVFLVCIGTVLFLRHREDFHGTVPGDFQVYQRAALRAQAAIDPYRASDSSPYKYSPGALVPFLLLPKDSNHAWALFKFISVVMLPAALLFGLTLKKWKDLLSLFIGLALAWKGLIETLDYGQLEFLVLFAAVLAARFYPKHPAAAGMILGVLPWFKLPWGFLVIPFVLASLRAGTSKTKRLMVGLLSGSIGLGILLPSLVFGPTKTIEWMGSWFKLLADQPRDLYWVDLNQSLWSTGVRWIAKNPWVGGGATLLAILACLYFLLKLSRRALREPIFKAPLGVVTPWLILMQLLNPLSWRWGSMLLVGVPFALEGRSKASHVKTGILLGGVGLLFLLQLNPVVQWLGWGHWTDLHPWGLITVYWIILLGLCV